MPLIEPDFLSEILSTASDITLLVNAEKTVTAVMVNPHHPAFGRLDTWVGAKIFDIVAEDNHDKLSRRISALGKPGAGSVTIEMNHQDASLLEFPVRYTMHQVRSDKSILMLGRDMRPLFMASNTTASRVASIKTR